MEFVEEYNNDDTGDDEITQLAEHTHTSAWASSSLDLIGKLEVDTQPSGVLHWMFPVSKGSLPLFSIHRFDQVRNLQPRPVHVKILQRFCVPGVLERIRYGDSGNFLHQLVRGFAMGGFCQVCAFGILVFWHSWAETVFRHFVVIASALWVGLLRNMENTHDCFLCVYLTAVIMFA